MPATISGIVFNDLNHNGVYDTGEPGITGVYVYLSSSSGMVETQTDVNGNYSFSVTAAGNYTVYETVAQNTINPPTNFTQPPGLTVSNGPRKILITVTAAQITGNVTIGNNNFAHDTNTNTLTCTANFIQFVGNPTEWVTINLVTGSDVDRGGLTPPHYINAIGYNTLDDYIYGYDDTVNGISRVDASGNIMMLGEPTGMPVTAAQYNTGCFDDQGYLYLYLGGAARMYVVDLRPNSQSYMKLVNPVNGYAEQTAAPYGVALVNGTPNIADWAWLPATAQTGTGTNGFLYGIQPGGVMARVNLDNAHVINMTTSGPTYNNSFGAMAVDLQNNIYAIANQNGNVYRYTINDVRATGSYFSNTYYDNYNDGAMCRNATLLIDYGDAPDTGIGNGPGNYNTLLANNGPRHQIVAGLTLGTQITGEEDAYQNSDATGDDLTQGIQDDGVHTPLPILSLSATTYRLHVTATNNTPTPANLYAWVDFNQNGLFEVNESSVVTVPANSGTAVYPMNFTVPTGVVLNSGSTFARFRLTTDTLAQEPDDIGQDAASVGPADDGEVEDYILTISAIADLQITKVANADTVAIGETLMYTITITNNGPDAAQTPLHIDAQPPEIKNPVYSIDNGVTWQNVALGSMTLPTLQPGAVFTILVKGVVNQFADGIIDNTASISSVTPDPNLSNNTATISTPIVNSADISIVKIGSPSTVTSGNTLTYTLVAANAGPSPAENTIITDEVPPAVLNPQYSLNAGISWNPWPSSNTINIGEMAAGANTNIVIRGTVASTAANPIANTATISSDTLDPNPDNNSSTLLTTVTQSADLALTKQSDQNSVNPGDMLTYTLQITNNGPSDAEAIQITDVIPAEMLNPEFSIDGGTTWQPWNGNYALASLANGAVYTLLIRGQIDPNTTIGATANTANVSSATPDPNLSNNKDNNLTSINQPVALEADISIRKTATPTTAIIGELLQYNIVVTNNGLDPASNVVLTENIPPQLLAPQISFDDINWDPFTTPIPLGDLADKASISLYIRGTIDPTINPDLLHTITNLATVIADTPDPNLDNNTTTRITPLQASADLEIEKILLTDPLIPGNPLRYQLTITNNGPSNAQSVILTDPIPTGVMNPQSSVDNGTSWQDWTGSLALGTLAAHQQETVLLQGTLSAATTTTVTNTATIYSSTPDPDLSNNTSTTNNDPEPTATLRVTKTATPNPVNVGDDLTYSIYVLNQGPSFAYNVIVTDVVPSELTNVLYSTDAINWYPWTGSYTYPTIPSGSARTLLIKGTVTTFTKDTISNTAHAKGDNTLDAANTVSVTVIDQADVGIIKWANVNHVIAGNLLQFSLTITNFGPSTSQNVLVTDLVPPTLANVEYSLDQINWQPWTGQYEVGDMTSDQVFIIYIQGTVTTAATGEIINTALVTSTTNDPNLANNSNSFEVHVGESADLSVTKTPDTSAVSPGDTVTYTLNIANAGPSDSVSAVLQDNIPTELDNVQFSLNGTDWNPWVSPYSLGNLVAGSNQTIYIRGIVSAGATNFVANTALITSSTSDPDPSNNTAISTIPIPAETPPSADVSITKLPNNMALPGEEITYTLTIANAGPNNAQEVIIRDEVPDNLENVMYSLDEGANWLTWTGSYALGTLAVNETQTILLKGTIATNATNFLSNTAVVSSATSDPDPTNNTANSTLPIPTDTSSNADLSVTKTSDSETITLGEDVVYNIQVVNNGPDAAKNVTITDVVHSTLKDPEYSLDGGATWSAWDGSLTLGDLGAGASVDVLIKGVPKNAGATANTVMVISNTADPDTTNNIAITDIPLAKMADLAVVKVSCDSFANPCMPIQYTIVVTNNGPDEAEDVILRDEVPKELHCVEYSLDNGRTWRKWSQSSLKLGTLKNGEKRVILLKGIVNESARGKVDNTASVRSSTSDPNLDNNTFTQKTRIFQ